MGRRILFMMVVGGWMTVSVAATGGSPRTEGAAAPRLFLPGIVSTAEAIEHGAAVTPDGSELWFTRARGIWGEKVARQSIYRARRQTDGSFGTAELAPFSGEHFDDDPYPSLDGRWIYFVSDRPATTKTGDGPDLWRVQRLDGGGWGEPEHLSAVSSPGYDSSPVLTADGTLWFASIREGGLGAGDLWHAEPDGTGGFAAPENLGAPLNTAGGEWNLLLAPDASWIVFEASGRAENVSPPGDLYIAHRKGENWTTPVNLRHLNSPGSDLLPRFGPQGTLLFASSRELDGTHTDIYQIALESVVRRSR